MGRSISAPARSRLASGLAVAAIAIGGSAVAQDVDAARVERGMELYKATGADCERCHGWAGSGNYDATPISDRVAGGPPLTTSKLDSAAMAEVVACGRKPLYGVMPRYRGDSWTNALRCYGSIAAELPAGQVPPTGARLLSPEDVEAVVAYVQATYVGKTMSMGDCLKYFSTAPRACDVYRR